MNKPEHSLQDIKEKFFSDPKLIIRLNKGEVLMKQGGLNDRLFLVLEGKLTAYSTDENENTYDVFQVHRDMFAGVYSFFSGAHISRTTIVADENSTLSYLESTSFSSQDDAVLMTRVFLPVVLSDLNARMQTAHKMAQEKEQAITHLLRAEKMATLGQLAAGLAHELNNAVGVVKNKSDWLAERIDELLKLEAREELYSFFKRGRIEGQSLSSREVRTRRDSIIEKFKVGQSTAKQLARTGYSLSELENYSHMFDELEMYWDVGASFHDISLAASHAAQVVQSVKELGAGSTKPTVGLNLSKTLNDAITLLQSVLRQVDVEIDLDETLVIDGSSGELVQVWINILKNACESMLQSKTESPLLRVELVQQRKMAVVKIIDNGPGIEPGMKTKIFQPNVTTKKDGLTFGLGLGLPISQRIVESHGGRIDVKSTVGHTEFIIKLPL